MGKYSKARLPKFTSQEAVLPSYKLDSNLVLLPGVIYNVTFSRFKAAALLYRFSDHVSNINVINNLLNEYDFKKDEATNEKNGVAANEQNEYGLSPTLISKDAEDGIWRFHNMEKNVQDAFADTSSNKEESNANARQETGARTRTTEGANMPTLDRFDWLTLAISPNLDRIKDRDSNYLSSMGRVVTVVKIVKVTDNTSTIRLTFKAVTRGLKVKPREDKEKLRANEEKILIDWNHDVYDLKEKLNTLQSNFFALNEAIENFLVAYHRASENNPSTIQGSNLSLVKEEESSSNKDESANKKDGKISTESQPPEQDLLTLNPLANALFLQLASNTDISKAYNSLIQLYSHFDAKIQHQRLEGFKDEKIYLKLVDLTAAILPFPNYEKLRLLNCFHIEDRSTTVNDMLSLLTKIFKNLEQNSLFANNWFFNEATNVQKANVVAKQLKSIRGLLEGMNTRNKIRQRNVERLLQSLQSKQRKGTNSPTSTRGSPSSSSSSSSSSRGENNDEFDDSNDDGDELKAISNFVKNTLPTISSLSSDSKRLILKDFKRIKSSANSPGGMGADYHVLRNYLEIVMDIPWDCFVTKFESNKDIDLQAAKAQLDLDHYGLEHVKRRLIQYLVVLKLLGINASYLANKERQELEKHSRRNSDDGDSLVGSSEHESTLDEQPNQKGTISTGVELQNGYLEQVAVSKNNKSPIIALTGPPGIGKTSIAKSIATSLGRNFQRLSLGGIKDESEIRGHRRTYVGAMPGLIIQALRKARCMNPVILLDEIDKVVGGNSGSSKFNGDPSAALLEVLDPEQNNTFIDHYLGFPVDLSQVIFICTANEPQNMTRPLLDRLELIQMGAYDYNEKLVIGRKYLLPRQIRRNGFPITEAQNDYDEYIQLDENSMKKIIVDYTREAGVRDFERKLGALCRYKAVEYCESLNDGNRKPYNPTIGENDLVVYLGVPFASFDCVSENATSFGNSKVGVVNGLSYNSEGLGSVLVFESIGFDRRFGKVIGEDSKLMDGNPGTASGSGAALHMTGRLGEVLMESGKIGLTLIKLMIYKDLLRVDGGQRQVLDKFNNLDIHMHVPMGSVPKDGPSAGVTMALLFLSVLLERAVPSDIAMTGEITLRGLVLPIGGVKEKMLGAHLSPGIKRMIVPRENRKDLIEEYAKCLVEEKATTATTTTTAAAANTTSATKSSTWNGDSAVTIANSREDMNLINELLRDNELPEFNMSQVEDYFAKKYSLQLYYAREFKDIVEIVWDEDLLVNGAGQKLIEYRI